jgi:pimeloyl-ACP methyl ester carboxylesterase
MKPFREARRLHSIYRSADGRQAVRVWCRRRLDQWNLPHHRNAITTLAGDTHIVSTTARPPTVVFVPGTNASAANYELLAAALAAHWPTLLLDLPGQPGLSAGDRPRRDRTAWYGRWLADVLRQTVTEPVIVVGHSLGGAVALACDSPYIGGRLLVATAGLARTELAPAVLGASIAWMLKPTPAHSSALIRHLLAPGHHPEPALVEWYTLVARHSRSSLAPPIIPDRVLTGARAVPCIVATGSQDAFLPPRQLQRPTELRLNTRLRVIPDAGHLVTDEHPELLVPLIEEIARTTSPT